MPIRKGNGENGITEVKTENGSTSMAGRIAAALSRQKGGIAACYDMADTIAD
ncbi:MAG: hypothetical protein LUF27_06110 [Lachnospiraceae bacterium]|nr:hypothetical protein [Lachnospiraceae bacterium]